MSDIAELQRLVRLYRGLAEAIDDSRTIIADGADMLLRRFEAVHALHQDTGRGMCQHCDNEYPCETIKVLFGDEEVSDAAGQDPPEHQDQGGTAGAGPG